MAFIDDVVEVQVIRVSITNPTTGFGIPFIIGNSLTTFPDIVKTYNSLEEVLSDFTIDQPEYLAAKAAFSQSTRVRRIKIAQATDVGYTTAYSVANTIDPKFYHVTCLSTNTDDQIDIAGIVETERKIMGITSDQAGIRSNTTGNLAETLKGLNYARTYGFYSETANTQFLSSALSSKMLSVQNNFPTWCYEQLSGVSGDSLTNNERHNITSNNFNYFVDLADDDVTFDGRMVNGSFIDTQVGIDWTTTNLELAIVNLLKAAPKIPYNVQGFGLVETALKAALQQAVDRGVIEPNPTIIMPELPAIPEVVRAERILEGVKIRARLTGAIHTIKTEFILTN